MKKIDIKQKLVPYATVALCICAHLLTLVTLFLGVVRVGRANVSVLEVVNYIMGVFYSFTTEGLLKCALGLFFIGFLVAIGKSFYTNCRLAVNFYKQDSSGKSEREALIKIVDRYFYSFSFLMMFYIMANFVGRSKLTTLGVVSFVTSGILFVAVYALMLFMDRKVFSVQYTVFEIIKHILHLAILCLMLEYVLSPSARNLINGFCGYFSMSFENVDFRIGVRYAYVMFIDHLIALVVACMYIRAVFVSATSFIYKSRDDFEVSEIKNAFKQTMYSTLVWGLCKCVIYTYFTAADSLPELSFDMVRVKWYGYVQGDALPMFLLAVAGVFLMSSSFLSVKKRTKKDVAPQKETPEAST